MKQPEDKAIDLFNAAIKECISLDMQPTKENAKELLLFKLLLAKEVLHDVTIFDNVPVTAIKKTMEHYKKIQTIIENI